MRTDVKPSQFIRLRRTMSFLESSLADLRHAQDIPELTDTARAAADALDRYLSCCAQLIECKRNC